MLRNTQQKLKMVHIITTYLPYCQEHLANVLPIINIFILIDLWESWLTWIFVFPWIPVSWGYQVSGLIEWINNSNSHRETVLSIAHLDLPIGNYFNNFGILYIFTSFQNDDDCYCMICMLCYWFLET